MKMTGTVRLVSCIVFAAGVPLASITSGVSRSSCVAADRIQSASPKPHWKSIWTLRPTTVLRGVQLSAGEIPMRNACLDAALAELDAAGIRDYQLARGGKHLQLRWTVAGHTL